MESENRTHTPEEKRLNERIRTYKKVLKEKNITISRLFALAERYSEMYTPDTKKNPAQVWLEEHKKIKAPRDAAMLFALSNMYNPDSEDEYRKNRIGFCSLLELGFIPAEIEINQKQLRVAVKNLRARLKNKGQTHLCPNLFLKKNKVLAPNNP